MDVVLMCSAHRTSMTVYELLECYNVAQEDQHEEDPRNIQLPKIEGKCTVEGLELESVVYA